MTAATSGRVAGEAARCAATASSGDVAGGGDSSRSSIARHGSGRRAGAGGVVGVAVAARISTTPSTAVEAAAEAVTHLGRVLRVAVAGAAAAGVKASDTPPSPPPHPSRTRSATLHAEHRLAARPRSTAPTSAVPTSRRPRAVGEDGDVTDAAAGGKAAPRQTRGREPAAGTRATSKAAGGGGHDEDLGLFGVAMGGDEHALGTPAATNPGNRRGGLPQPPCLTDDSGWPAPHWRSRRRPLCLPSNTRTVSGATPAASGAADCTADVDGWWFPPPRSPR